MANQTRTLQHQSWLETTSSTQQLGFRTTSWRCISSKIILVSTQRRAQSLCTWSCQLPTGVLSVTQQEKSARLEYVVQKNNPSLSSTRANSFQIEGFVTDQDRNIEVFARNFDPCTGDVTERLLSVVVPRSAAVRGQWRYRTNVDDIMPATREVVARISGEDAVQQGNGLQAGQFISPILAAGWIWPELIVFGQNQIPNDFQLLPILSQGIGPFGGGLPGGDVFSDPLPLVGQLDPWPGIF